MIPDPNRAFRFTAAEMQARLPAQGGQRFAIALERGELQAEFYAPQQIDHQQPHDRDECYVVVRGEGRFVMGGETVPYRSVPAISCSCRLACRIASRISATTWRYG